MLFKHLPSYTVGKASTTVGSQGILLDLEWEYKEITVYYVLPLGNTSSGNWNVSTEIPIGNVLE